MVVSDPKPIRYLRGHVSNVFSRIRWHDEWKYQNGAAIDNRDPIEVWNAERAAERHAFAVANAKRREAELREWQAEKDLIEREASPEGRAERDRAWRRAFGGKDKTK
jgi:hypothetical protein